MSKNYSKNGKSNPGKGKGKPDFTKQGSKGKKPYTSKRGDEESKRLDNPDALINFPGWYVTNSNAVAMDNAFGFTFSNFVGDPIERNSGSTRWSTSTLRKPSIAINYVNPSVGYIDRSNPLLAAINRQGLRTYNQLSSINAKTTQYGPEDISIALLALGEIIKMRNYIQRAIGLVWTVNIRNRAFPKYALESMGIDYDDLTSNIANYVAAVNAVLARVNFIRFPDSIAYFAKCRESFLHLFLDAESPMAQVFCYSPYSTWVLDESSSETGSVLKTRNIHNTTDKVKISDLIEILNEQIDALATSATLNYLYPDVQKYCSKIGVNFFSIEPIVMNFAVVPIFNREASLQWHNSTIVGAPTESGFHPGFLWDYNDVMADADSSCLRYHPVFAADIPWGDLDVFMDYPNGEPDINMKLEATRYIAAGGKFYGGSGHPTAMWDMYLPDQYIVETRLYSPSTHVEAVTLRSNYVDVEHSANAILHLTTFDWHPWIWLVNHESAQSWTLTNLDGDLEFYTTVSAEKLGTINELAFYGLFELR